MKTIIVGGGVAGASTAIKLAEKNDNVHLIDKNPFFNKACSGILTYAVDDLIKIKPEVIVGKIKTFKIIAPNKEILEINFKRPDIVCERKELNKYLNDLAHDKGVVIHKPSSLEKINTSSIIIRESDELKEISTNNLIGADGSQSSVAKFTGIFGNIKFFVGAKAIIEKEHDDCIEVYPGIGCFSWIVPHGEKTVEAGTMSYPWQGSVFEKFLKRFDGKILSKEGALIPVHNPFVKTFKKYRNINTYLIGDAATMVKATTGGSIIQSFIASQCLADSIIYEKNYSFSWRKKIGLELLTHLQIRKAIDKFKDKDWNKIIHLLKDVKAKNVFETKTRDHPIELVFNLIKAKPSILSYGKYLL